MPNTAYSTLRQNLMKVLGVARTGTTTSAGGGSGTSLVSTDLQKYDGGNDDHYNGMWLMTTSGSTQATVFVNDYVASSSMIVPRPSFTAQIASSVTFEVLPWEPAVVLDAYQRAIAQAYPKPEAGRKGLFRTIYEEIVANSLIWNGHFEDWDVATVPDHWVENNSAQITTTEETSTIRGPVGSSACKLVGTAANNHIYQSQAENFSLLELENRTVTFYAWAWASAASKGDIGIYTKVKSGTTTTTLGSTASVGSGFHSGGSEWELLYVQASIPVDATDIQLRLYCNDGTVYFDNAYLEQGPYVYRYHMSKDFLHDPLLVEMQINAGNGTGGATGGAQSGADMLGQEAWQVIPRGFWHIDDDGTNRLLVIHRRNEGSLAPYAAWFRRKIRITGIEALSNPTTDSSTVEVAGDQARALTALAAAELMLTLNTSASAADKEVLDYARKADQWRTEAERMLSLYGMPLPRSQGNVRVRG